MTTRRVSAKDGAAAGERLGEDWRGWLEERAQRWVPWYGAIDKLRSAPAGQGNRKRRLAETAALYVRAVADGVLAVNEHVAKIQGRPAYAVRDDIYAARQAGLLTPAPKQGRPGGHLTRAAIDILKGATE